MLSDDAKDLPLLTIKIKSEELRLDLLLDNRFYLTKFQFKKNNQKHSKFVIFIEQK